MNRIVWQCASILFCTLVSVKPLLAADQADRQKGESSATQTSVVAPLYERFAPPEAQADSPTHFSEVPDFQKHISPLFGRLGCNGRACHGSFQGQGGFQLSLFGYDFQQDYEALLEDGAARVDLDDKPESLILTKPVDEDMHDGGKRYEHGGWEYWVFKSWIDAGAPFEAKQIHQLKKLEVTPKEVLFSDAEQTQQLKAIAHWEDGTQEDVTCLCRFQSNDSAVAAINEAGVIKSGDVGDTHVVISYDNAVVPIPVLQPVSKSYGDNYPSVVAATQVDALVIEKLRKLGIVPSEVCSDQEFLRRASLDVTGTLPSPAEVVAFTKDSSPDKRERKIEELLERPGYAAQWTTFLCDVTGNNDDQLRNFLPQSVNPSDQWYQWIRARLEDNVPYDEIVEGIVTANSRLPDESYVDYCREMSDICRDKSGEKFADRPGLVYYWSRNNFRTAEDRAIGFAYSFLGVRIQCAQCHKHPFDQWSKNDFDQFEKLFTSVQARQNTMYPDAKVDYKKLVSKLGVDKELKGNLLRREFGKLLNQGKTVPMPELVVAKPRVSRNSKGKSAPLSTAKLLGGDTVNLAGDDVRVELMDWLRAPENPYFAKALVNRVWAQYFGTGIVDPPDDLNLANAPSNARLLEHLADGFRESGFDLKWLHREILNSDTYQRSWEPNETNSFDQKNFSHSQLRRLSAEATYDALRTALSNDAQAEKTRELEVARALTKAGASARRRTDDLTYALTVFGRSIRESNCDCDRSSEPSLLQTIFLNNDSAMQEWLGDSKTSWASEVARKYGWSDKKSAVADQAKRRQLEELFARFSKQVKEAERQLAKALERDNDKLVRSIRKRKADLIRRARAVAKKQGAEAQFEGWLVSLKEGAEPSLDGPEPTQEEGITNEEARWIVENAYLRTLSRQPKVEEMDRVMAYLQSEEDPKSAVEGLMWSLVNTKEFILNH